MSATVGVVGATGYLGTELVKLLEDHPQLDLAAATSTRQAGRPLDEAVPALAGTDLALQAPDPDDLAALDAALLATPSGAAAELVPQIRQAGTGTCVVDLSGAHRLADPSDHADHYPDVERSPAAADVAVYGLPELAGPTIAAADLVANPGCYPTGAILSILPALQEGWVDRVHVASVSGISGAGRTPTAGHHFPEANESVRAYDVGQHRHGPEIEQAVAAHADETPVAFVPHVAPMDRGIHTTAFLDGADVDPGTAADLVAKAYAAAPFVCVVETTPRTKDVRGTNRLDLHVAGTEGGLVVTAVHDNLVKGGAGQALQNLNLMLGFDETAGLPTMGGGP